MNGNCEKCIHYYVCREHKILCAEKAPWYSKNDEYNAIDDSNGNCDFYCNTLSININPKYMIDVRNLEPDCLYIVSGEKNNPKDPLGIYKCNEDGARILD